VSLLFPGVQTQDYQQSFLWLYIENIVVYSTEPKSKCFSRLSVSRNLCFILLRCLFSFCYKRGVIICNASHSQISIPSLLSTKKVRLTGLGSLINNHSTDSPCEALEIPSCFLSHFLPFQQHSPRVRLWSSVRWPHARQE
jgi:hypothetical protein